MNQNQQFSGATRLAVDSKEITRPLPAKPISERIQQIAASAMDCESWKPVDLDLNDSYNSVNSIELKGQERSQNVVMPMNLAMALGNLCQNRHLSAISLSSDEEVDHELPVIKECLLRSSSDSHLALSTIGSISERRRSSSEGSSVPTTTNNHMTIADNKGTVEIAKK